MKKVFVLISGIILSHSALSAEHIVTQENLKFSTPFELIRPGDVVVFKNNDTTSHNIISLSDGNKFNIGTFKPGMIRSVKFNDAGVVDVECSIHPDMKMTVFVWAK